MKATCDDVMSSRKCNIKNLMRLCYKNVEQ